MLLATATSAVAKPKKSTRPVCASALQCARACDGKHKAACDRLWTLVDDRLEQQRGSQIYAPDPAIYAAARTSLPKACGRKNRRACVLLGRLEEQGRGGAGDVTTAARRFGEACDAGETTGCVALGRGYQRGSLPDASTAKARDAFERACKKKDPEGCYLQGKMIADGIGGAADLVTGIGMIKDACTAGSGGACGALAVMYRYGVEQTIVADASKARDPVLEPVTSRAA